MKLFLKKIPMPIVGIMLAFAALGNLIQSYGELYRNIAGIIAISLFLVSTIKFIADLNGLINELNTPIGGSVFATYSMGIMILSTYIKPYQPTIAFVVWIVGILLHLIIMVRFVLKFVVKFHIKQVYPTWFIVFVGIAAAAVTGKAFSPTIGQIAFCFGLFAYLILLLVVGKRVFIVKDMLEPTHPTLIIFAAPGSLCLAGYLNSFDQKSLILFWILFILSQGFYLFALTKLATLLKMKFYPSYTSFTFPLVISATALKLSNNFLISQGITIGFLPIVVKIEECIAVFMVCYVLVRYLMVIFKPTKK